ncbi:MAG: flagellar biosynthesis anti-sigma factor FlgM [Rhizobacter sp.]|nr:flagellar biosynthesis anti-sigma factor FlgM [Rhizobacter sp.]
MKISSSGIPMSPASLPVSSDIGAREAAATSPSASQGGSAALQSSVIRPAMSAMRQMPEIDQARVESLRDAIAKGELTFDAGKLAGLIQRYHGSRA